MTLCINPDHIIWDKFDELEPPQEEWRDQIEYWEDYLEKFFHSNGMTYTPDDGNVEQWLLASDRAPFSEMVRQLLPRLSERTDLSETEAVLLSHWLPDLHMGTSVTNFIMHQLGLTDCFGFAISDRGLSAPFFAFDTLHKCLNDKKQSGLLVIADQKHLLYKSDVVEKLKPNNTAAVIRLDLTNARGFEYRGYQRNTLTQEFTASDAMNRKLDSFEMAAQATTLIGPKSLLDAVDVPFDDKIETDPSLVCTAPFAAFADVSNIGRDYMLLCQDNDHVTALGLKGGRQ